MILRAILITAILVCSSAAFAADPVLDCAAIRAAVAEHGRVKAIRWAREQGYTWAQIAAARRCLK